MLVNNYIYTPKKIENQKKEIMAIFDGMNVFHVCRLT